MTAWEDFIRDAQDVQARRLREGEEVRQLKAELKQTQDKLAHVLGLLRQAQKVGES